MRVRSVKLLTARLEELQRFYSEVLELPIVDRCADCFTVQVGQSGLIFERDRDSGEQPFYHYAMEIPARKLTEAIRWLEGRRVRLNELPAAANSYYSKSWNSTSVYFYDHAGNIVEFIARHGVENESAGPFRSTDVLGICEIGLVVPNVQAAREWLQEALSLEAYKEYDNHFAAIGDEVGLFILSEHKRIWLGSNKPAAIYRTEVEIVSAEEREYAYADLPYRIKAVRA